jgi:delta-aminolevulinic acid dehydratase/porphobilinogen synthase
MVVCGTKAGVTVTTNECGTDVIAPSGTVDGTLVHATTTTDDYLGTVKTHGLVEIWLIY